MSQWLEDLARRIEQALPDEVKAVHEQGKQHMRTVIQAALADLDWVPREDFEAQVRVLHKLRQQLNALETRLAALEKERSDS